MYNDRTLSTEEQLYVDRAQEKIAELGKELADEAKVNDVTYSKHQLALELQYSIEFLTSTFTDASETGVQDDIERMISFYTNFAELWEYSGTTNTWTPPPSLPGSGYVTQAAFNSHVAAATQEDVELQSNIDAEEAARIAGDASLQSQIDAIEGASAAATTAEITVQTAVGGVPAGRVYPIGTTFQSIFEELFGAVDTLSDLTFSSYAAIVKVNTVITPAQFTWAITGDPGTLTLSDNKSNVAAVTGTSETIGWTYTEATPTSIIWTLDGSSSEPITLETKVVYPTISGTVSASDDTPVTITSALMDAGVESVLDTSTGTATVNMSVSAGQQGFIAVPTTQTNGAFTDWLVEDDNRGNILSTGSFIIGPTTLNYGGVNYSVYQWGYRSPLTHNVTLFR